MIYTGKRGDDATAQDYEIALALTHTPHSSGTYSENMSYQVQDKYQGGTCATSSATPSGWSDNFSWFKAEFDQADLAGDYAYAWQAGPNDANSRILNVELNPSKISDETGAINADGEAWYGYGGTLTSSATTIGRINGFICNWAGPGSTNTLVEKAQRQFISKGTSGLYETVTGGSNLTYAPTNSCFYSSGSFQYDRDLSGALDSADMVKVVTTPADATELKFQLFPYTGLYFTDTTTYPDIESIITARGFSLPDDPSIP